MFSYIFDNDDCLAPKKQYIPYIDKCMERALRRARIRGDLALRVKRSARGMGFLRALDSMPLSEKERGILVAAHESLRAPPSTKPFKDVRLVEKCEGLRFLVTAGTYSFQSSKVEQLGIADMFDEVHVTPDDKESVFRDIVDRHGLIPAHTIVLGDNASRELRAAYAIGMIPVQILRPGVIPGQAMYQVADLAGFLRLVEWLKAAYGRHPW